MSSQVASENEIQANLNTVFTKLQNVSTTQIGYELFKRLINNKNSSENIIHFILNSISSTLTSLPLNTREPFLKLISLIFQNDFTSPSQKAIYYPFITSSLTILQSQITDNNTPLYSHISNVFADITLYTMITDIESSQGTLGVEEKKQYEILQGFCIYNMKEKNKSNQICGSLCLTKLVENCPIVLQIKYLNFIWENIVNFIDKNDYNAKYELLNCLISLILGAESKFKPNAVVTLFKVMEFLTDNDWLKRKLALNVIYTIAFYCKEEIASMKTHLSSFLKLLKNDKVKDVREIAISIIKLLSEVNLNESTSKRSSKRTKSPILGKSGGDINRKEDYIVNDKMIIKTNPEKTTFKSGMNNKEDVVLAEEKLRQHKEEFTEEQRNDDEDKDIQVDNIKENENMNQFSQQEEGFNKKQMNIEPQQLNEFPKDVQTIDSSSNSKMISALLSQMNMLTSKQLLLLDTISQIQNETQSQINNLNNKITSLESTLSSLTTQMMSPKSQPSHPDINTFFKQALSKENSQEILNLLSKTPLSQLKNVNIDLIEETIERLIPLLSKGENVKQIISFYKTVLLALRLPLRNEIIHNVKNVLEYITRSGVDGRYIGNISEEEIIDISIILSSLIENK